VGKETEVLLPDIGDFAEVEVIEVLVAKGDRVRIEDSLITLESDKAAMEIPAPYSGVVGAVKVAVGDKISAGDLLLSIEVDEDAAAQTEAQGQPAAEDGSAQSPPAPTTEEVETVQARAAASPKNPAAGSQRLPGDKLASPPPVPPLPTDVAAGRKAHASPGVRRFARELGVDLLQVSGSGPKGRVTKDDVQSFVKKSLSGALSVPRAPGPLELPPGPPVDFARFGEVEHVPLGRIRKLSGAHLHRSWLTVPHVTQFDEADITQLEAFRKDQKALAAKQDIRLTLFPFLLKGCAAALTEFPDFNSSLGPDGEHLVYKKYCHIGVAVDTPNGLVVPVIRDVDSKGIFELAQELGEVSARAREGKLLPADMQGGCFSISSLGSIGGTNFTPIINAPEVAILGVSRSEIKPLWDGREFKPRLMLPLCLSYDHRVIDGAAGARFTTFLAGLLSDIRRLLL
jgi:pyruvate dehydrogenase E2 component (dihydrolipoamide acetyltransferase)